MQNLILRRTPESYLSEKRTLGGLNLLLKFILKRVYGRASRGVRDYKRVGSFSEFYQISLNFI